MSSKGVKLSEGVVSVRKLPQTRELYRLRELCLLD